MLLHLFPRDWREHKWVYLCNFEHTTGGPLTFVLNPIKASQWFFIDIYKHSNNKCDSIYLIEVLAKNPVRDATVMKGSGH